MCTNQSAGGEALGRDQSVPFVMEHLGRTQPPTTPEAYTPELSRGPRGGHDGPATTGTRRAPARGRDADDR